MKKINTKYQTILAFQEGKKAEPKVNWIKKITNKELIQIRLITVTSDLPDIIDDSASYLPETLEADLILDYLNHPDLSNDLASLCIKNAIPIISSGKKISLGKNHYTPLTCCSLNRSLGLGEYSNYFGKPELTVNLRNDTILEIKILHGSPCGSTWKAAKKIIGLSVEDAPTHFGLAIQWFCTANASNWNPITGKNPIHIAAELHKNALSEAIKNSKPTSSI